MSLYTYISMLRGINVGGQKMIRMQELVTVYESLGFANVSTFIQSGNVIFSCESQDISLLIARIEEQIKNHFGYSVTVFIRTVSDLAQIIATNPFKQPADRDNKNIYVTFLQDQHSEEEPSIIQTIPESGEEYIRIDREIVLFCPNGYSRTKLNNNFFERKYKMPATTRNWNSVNALYEKARLL